MKHVYVDDDNSRHAITSLALDSIILYTEYDDFLKITSPDKIAVFHFLGEESDRPTRKRIELKNKLNLLIRQCQAIIMFSSELCSEDAALYKQYNQPNVYHYLCGFVDGVLPRPWMDWFYMTANEYNVNPSMLAKLTPYETKPLYFDILLGLKKPHRDKIYNYVIDNNLQDRVLMTYYQTPDKSLTLKSNSEWIKGVEGDIESKCDMTHSSATVNYQGRTMYLSMIAPVDIYNQTAYTIVAETKADPGYTFYTEKIVKPILAERLFIVFAGENYLQNLRNLGFKTFNGIIDESYDSVKDANIRFNMALEQMRQLLDRPQREVLDLIRPITEHNKKLMLENNWRKSLDNGIEKIILGN